MPSEDFFSAISISPALKLSSRHNEFLNWSCPDTKPGSKSLKDFQSRNIKYFDYPTVFFILEARMLFFKMKIIFKYPGARPTIVQASLQVHENRMDFNIHGDKGVPKKRSRK